MKVLWICNQCIPQIADKLHIPASGKEGWIAGLYDEFALLDTKPELGVVFPYPENKDFAWPELSAFGFKEDTNRPEIYDEAVTQRMKEIMDTFRPDLVHIFGTEYAHTLSAATAFNNPYRLLIGFQGICRALADAYLTGVPEKWIHRKTFRDRLKDDNMFRQKEKFELRAEHEAKAVSKAGFLTGRTGFDKELGLKMNPSAEYLFLNETLRKTFYEGTWKKKAATKHSIFISQCDYPIKGFHILIRALEIVMKEYPDVTVRVAGIPITGVGGLKKKILIPTYGKYLKTLMKKTKTEEKISFLGVLTAEEMKKEYLSCSVFVLPSVMENSPNCVGEAMLLGVPVVASNVGGVSDILTAERDGILYEDNKPELLADAIKRVFQGLDNDDSGIKSFCENAMADAREKHDGKENARILFSMYEKILKS